MHREKRLGLAMGLLIVAIVGAFFFRVQPTSHDQIPELAQQESIDNMISQMPTGPYLAGMEDDDSPIQQANPKHRFSQNLPMWNVPELMKEQQQLATNHEETESSFTPDPIPEEKTGTTFSVSHKRINKPAKDNQSEGASDAKDDSAFDLPALDVSLEKGVFPKQSKMFEDDKKIEMQPSHTTFKARPYRVKAGDTLSSLAEKYLGDKKRFQEIYRVNKTKLHSEGDLRVGMLIRMPFVPRMALHQKAGVASEAKDVFAKQPKPQKKDYHLTIESEGEHKKPILEGEKKQVPAIGSKAVEENSTSLRQWPFNKQPSE